MGMPQKPHQKSHTTEIIMRNFAIVTDSASDLPAEYFEEHDIACVDLGFNLDVMRMLDAATRSSREGREVEL